MSDIYDPFGEFEDLYNPSYSYLLEELRKESKILIMNQIYKNLISRDISIDFNNQSEIVMIIENLLNWFEKREEYEKCMELKKILNKC